MLMSRSDVYCSNVTQNICNATDEKAATIMENIASETVPQWIQITNSDATQEVLESLKK